MFARKLVIALALWSALGLAHAVDGVFEINDDCAQVGCFAGDTVGYPVSIGQSGSYRLTGNLIVPDLDTTAIQVTSDNVSIDLNGFEIRGPLPCTVGPVTCPPPGLGAGISSGAANLTVANGHIIGMGGDGILAGDGAVLSNLTVIGNAGNGAVVGVGGRVLGCTIRDNGGEGVSSGDEGLVVENVVIGNVGLGLNLGSAAGFARNVLNRNAGGTGQLLDTSHLSPLG